MLIIVFVSGALSFVTAAGNMLVMISIRVNRRLQTVNNYFLFSLACADLIIGVFSMNLYTVYKVKGYWPLGVVVCDLWLVVDYVVSNASNMNLLIISLDRYLCVTRPLTYPARRTPKFAGLMISAGWLLSLLLWLPAILTWQHSEGRRAVRTGECYIQLLSSPAVTLVTALTSFYLPVIAMTVLYARIALASHRRLSRLNSVCESQADSSSANINPLPVPNRQEDFLNANCTIHTNVEKGPPASKDGNFSPSQAISDASAKDPCSISLAVRPNMNLSTKYFGKGRCPISEIIRPFWTNEPGSVPAHDLSPAAQLNRRRPWAARERKMTQIILAVLLAFIITGTPYHVMVLIGTFCHSCIPDTIWTVGYWLCYVNSTINPACYALCNVTFKKTFKKLLLCQYKNISSK
ncbi:muscarinic acetylcholine receptor M4 [Denticeps clupeoides]|nr:muscarinic acetylcholine receptor M4-like [Denticeps clupeoides]